MFAVTKDIVNAGILNYNIQSEKYHNGEVLIFLDSEEVLNSCFFDRIFNIQIKYNCDIKYKYSEEFDCIVIVIY